MSSGWKSLSGKLPTTSSPNIDPMRTYEEALASRPILKRQSYDMSQEKKNISFVDDLKTHHSHHSKMSEGSSQYHEHLKISFDDGVFFVLMYEPKNAHCGVVASKKENCKCKNSCHLIKEECHDEHSYLDYFCTKKVAKFLYEHPCNHLLIAHQGHHWLVKGEGLVEKKNQSWKKPKVSEYSFVADHFNYQGEPVPDGVYPIWLKEYTKEEFCLLSVEASALFIDAEINEAWSLKKKTMESLEKKYLHLKKLLDETHNNDNNHCTSVCEKAEHFYKKMHKLHNELEAHMKVMKAFLHHCEGH